MKKLLFFTISLLTLLSNLSDVEPTMEFGRVTINHKWLTVNFAKAQISVFEMIHPNLFV